MRGWKRRGDFWSLIKSSSHCGFRVARWEKRKKAKKVAQNAAICTDLTGFFTKKHGFLQEKGQKIGDGANRDLDTVVRVFSWDFYTDMGRFLKNWADKKMCIVG